MKYFFINLLIICVLLYLFGFRTDLLFIGGDYNGYLSSKQLAENLSVWNNNTFVFYNLSLIIKYFIFYTYSEILHLPSFLANFMGFVTLIMFGLYSAKIFIRFILNKIDTYFNDEKILYLLSYFYIFSLYFSIRFIDGHIDFVVFYYSLPLVFYLLSRFIDTNQIKYGIYSVLSVVFLSNIFISIYLVFFSFIIFVSYYLLYTFFTNTHKTKLRSRIGKLVLLGIIFLLISLPFLLNYYYYSNSLDVSVLGTDPINFIKNISQKNSFTDFLVGHGYWALADGFDGNYYYTFHQLIANKLVVTIKLLFLLIIIFSLIFKQKHKKFFYIFISLFVIAIFLQTFFYLLIKFNRIDLLEIFVDKLPFLREPVAKIEGLYYIALTGLLSIFLLQFFKYKYRNIIISMLFLWVIFDMYIFSISFKDRYSTNFIDSNYITHQKKIDINKSDRFIVLPSNGDYVCIKNYTRYCGPNILKGVSKGEYYISPGGAQIVLDNPDIGKIMNTIKGKGINKVVILKDYKYVISGTSYEKHTQELITEISKNYNSIYDDNRISLLDLGKRQYFNTNGYIKLIDKQISKSRYDINVNITGTGEIVFNDTYNKYWEIYDKNNNKIDFEHNKTDSYTNSWVITKQALYSQIKQNYSNQLKSEGYPKTLSNGKKDFKYFLLNDDGSIELELKLYFKPQKYFQIGLLISCITILLCISYLGYLRLNNKKNA